MSVIIGGGGNTKMMARILIALGAILALTAAIFFVASDLSIDLSLQISHQLQSVLDDAVKNPEANFPGVLLHVSGPRLCCESWSLAAGLSDIESELPLEPDDRFRAGSIMKPLVSVVVLLLVEEGELSLDDVMPEVLDESIYSKILNSDIITVRMLLNHTSGIAEFLEAPGILEKIVANPMKMWSDEEWIDSAATQNPFFPPGKSWTYSNTDYVLLGQIIEHATGRPWREEIRERILKPLELHGTSLPEPGDTSIPGSHAHGYMELDGDWIDVTAFDPSMAGASGGSALVTTTEDLARFLDVLLAGELFRKRQTLSEMIDFVDAPAMGGAIGYGLGLEQYMWPGKIEAIGHGGGTAGYRSLVVHLPAQEITIVSMQTNMESDPGLIIFPVLEILLNK